MDLLLVTYGCWVWTFISEEALNIWVGITLARLLTLDGTWHSFAESFSRNAPYIISSILEVCISDLIPFFLGKLFRQSGASDDVCSRLGIGKEEALNITHMVQKYHNLSGFVERFSLGVRNPTAFLAGAMDCLLCPTGFAANMALMVTIGSIASLLAVGRKPSEEERIAIFSDTQNHASIIDGIYLAERQQSVEVFVYRHCDMSHLNALLLKCKLKRKVIVTDRLVMLYLFSMDGDFAPMVEIAKLCKKHKFLFIVDDAHGTLVCGKNGGGVAEEFNCERDVDICIGSLSKATGCIGGFIACSISCLRRTCRKLIAHVSHLRLY
ncbi:8-amino-7-oxononanoate synthase-like [Quercus robur]|uniref:8-amino-7-oxononanoate synthase-like n=1 Tax=Quercus robur TaxID=38942 RepID=UPI0021618E39|nr:8-amino-7-oxononanoate synthase-like [Quercus robur]